MNQLKTKLVREITTHYSSAHLPSSSTPILPTIFDFENHHFKQAHEHKAQNTLTYKPKISHKPKTHIHRSKAHTYPSTNSLGQTTHSSQQETPITQPHNGTFIEVDYCDSQSPFNRCHPPTPVYHFIDYDSNYPLHLITTHKSIIPKPNHPFH